MTIGEIILLSVLFLIFVIFEIGLYALNLYEDNPRVQYDNNLKDKDILDKQINIRKYLFAKDSFINFDNRKIYKLAKLMYIANNGKLTLRQVEMKERLLKQLNINQVDFWIFEEEMKEGIYEINRNKMVNVPKGARKNQKSKRTK